MRAALLFSSAPACDFFPSGAHSETVRVSCYSVIHVLSVWGAVLVLVRSASPCHRRSVFTLHQPHASLRLLVLSSASCVASISLPSVPAPSNRRPRIGNLASASRLGWYQITDCTGAAVSSIRHADGSIHLDPTSTPIEEDTQGR